MCITYICNVRWNTYLYVFRLSKEELNIAAVFLFMCTSLVLKGVLFILTDDLEILVNMFFSCCLVLTIMSLERLSEMFPMDFCCIEHYLLPPSHSSFVVTSKML